MQLLLGLCQVCFLLRPTGYAICNKNNDFYSTQFTAYWYADWCTD